MEKGTNSRHIVHKGIPITIETAVRPTVYTNAEIILHGPRKMWQFTVSTFGEDHADGTLLTEKPTAIRTPGETTALAEIGMQELARYAHDSQTSFPYMFITDNLQLRKWFRRRGKRALGIKAPYLDKYGRIIAVRQFTPQTLDERPRSVVGFIENTWERMKTSFAHSPRRRR